MLEIIMFIFMMIILKFNIKNDFMDQIKIY